MTGGEVFEASYLQESLYRAADDGESAVNVAVVLRLSGVLDRDRLFGALSGLAARHEALRTALASHGGQVQQVVAPSLAVPATVLDVTAELDPDAEAVRLIRDHLRRPFDLHGPSLWRAMLISCGHDRHLLALSLHHAIMDGWSARVLTDELRLLYGDGDSERLAPPSLQFADYAAWERKTADSVPLAPWTERLSTDNMRARPPGASDPGPEQLAQALELPEGEPGLLDDIQKLSRERRVPVVAVLAAAVAVSLRECGEPGDAATGRARVEPSLTMGLVRANREHAELRDVVGYLADILPLTVDLRGDPDFGSLVSRVAESLAFSQDHAAPLAALSRVIRSGRPEGPLFDVCINFLPAGPASDQAAGPLRIARVDIPERDIVRSRWWDGTAVIDYHLRSDESRRLSGRVRADINAIPPDRLEDLGERFWSALARGSACPDLPLSALVPISAGGRQ